MSEPVIIASTDFWVKVVGMLQQNWALIATEEAGTVRIYFIGNTSGVFDEITLPSVQAAHEALERNGFERFADNTRLQPFLRSPSAPFRRAPHPNGPIYSSGRFWQS